MTTEQEHRRRFVALPFFLVIVAVILYITGAVLYEAAALAFGITASWQLLTLGLCLGVFSSSFIAASLLGAYYYNRFTRVYYTLAASWIGMFFYLFAASMLYGFVVLVGNVLYPTASLSSIGTIFLSIGLLAGIYGLAHTRRIVLARYSMALHHLPSAWRGKTAVFVSDLHLGQLHGPNFAKKVTTAINELSPQIIFIGGDLYDGTSAPDPTALIAPLKHLSAPWGVYFITGNHEEFGDDTRFIAAIKNMNIRVLKDEMVTIEGVQIVGVDYKNAVNKEEFAKILSRLAIDAHKPSILLKHEPKDIGVARSAGISLQLSGHTHKAQMWPLEFIAKLMYKEFYYGLQHSGNTQVITSSGVGTWGPPLRVGTNSEIVEITFS